MTRKILVVSAIFGVLASTGALVLYAWHGAFAGAREGSVGPFLILHLQAGIAAGVAQGWFTIRTRRNVESFGEAALTFLTYLVGVMVYCCALDVCVYGYLFFRHPSNPPRFNWFAILGFMLGNVLARTWLFMLLLQPLNFLFRSLLWKMDARGSAAVYHRWTGSKSGSVRRLVMERRRAIPTCAARSAR